MVKVGKKCIHLSDLNRPNWYGKGPRPLVIEVWYPASDNVIDRPFEFGHPEPRFKTNSIAENAPIKASSELYPLILMSHGTGGSALGMGWLGHYLATQGYIAVSVNHHGNNAIEPYLEHGFMLWWERAADFSVLIDLLSVEVDFLIGKIDFERIGFAGFSLGGCTGVLLAGGRCDLNHLEAFCASNQRDSICDGPREFPTAEMNIEHLLNTDDVFYNSWQQHQLSYKDDRIKAVLIISPALAMAFPDQSLGEIEVPVKVVVTATDNEVPPETNAHRFAEHISGANLEILPGKADHYVFLAEATAAGRQKEPHICIDDPSVNRRQIHQMVGELAVNFFIEHL